MLRKKLFIRCAAVVLLCLVALGVAILNFGHQTRAASPLSHLPIGGPGNSPASGPAKVVLSPVSMVTSNALEYWTPEKMKAAHPADELIPKHVVKAPEPPKVGTTPAFMDPVLPDTTSEQAAPKAQSAAATAKSTAQPQASPVAYPYAFPYSAVGKVFFTDPKTNLDYTCSATAVASTNGSTIDTAGHCVANGGRRYFYTHWTFCAQYHDGCDTKYMWAARRLLTHTNWYQKGWLTYDYGEAVVNPNDSGDVNEAVGGAGVAYNQPYQQHYTALGYPQAAPYDGKQLEECQSDLYRRDQPNPGPSTLSITCDMTGGSSGGGWLISEQGKSGYLNGHNDYKYNNDEAHMYSPYYGDDWYSVYNAAQSA